MLDTSKMSMQELYEYRCKLYRDAISFKKPDRIPICGNLFTWMFLDAGYKPTEATRNYDMVEESMIRALKEYKLDQINVLNSGFRNAFLVSDALGGSATYTSENAENLTAIMEDIMLPDEYDLAINDNAAWIWKAAFRKYPKLKEMSAKEIAEATKTAGNHFTRKYITNKKLHDELGALQENDIYGFCPAFENLSSYRGLKGLSMDLRRQKDKVLEYCRTNDNATLAGYKAWLEAQPEGPNMLETCDCCIWILAHTLCNKKQFELYYAPMLEEAINMTAAKGKQIIFWTEGEWGRFGEFFNKFPKGTVCLMVEQDDIFEMREKYPNIALMGGISRDLLSSGTPEQCVAQVKEVIDRIGKDGGLILQPNKMISYANDCKPENLKAVCDFVVSYEI